MAGRWSFLKRLFQQDTGTIPGSLAVVLKSSDRNILKTPAHILLLHHVTIYTDKSDMTVSSRGPISQSFLEAEDTKLVLIHCKHI